MLFETSGGAFDQAEPVAVTGQAGIGSLVLEFADCTSGMVSYDIQSLGLAGEIPIQRVVEDNVPLCEVLAAAAVPACTRPQPDASHGPNDPEIYFPQSLVEQSKIVDGGPGPDGIPPLEMPAFIENAGINSADPDTLVVGVKIGDDIRAYPHNILDWHEVVNEEFLMDGAARRATLSYCPLTGSAVMWKSFTSSTDQTFGTSGTLYNSNLILYDRETRTLWSQMLEQGLRGDRVTVIPERLQVVETTWETWQSMYPDTSLLSENTGFSRDYNAYAYGNFKESNRLLFPVENDTDDRLHRKERVLGINVGDASQVYPIKNFSTGIEVINETGRDRSSFSQVLSASYALTDHWSVSALASYVEHSREIGSSFFGETSVSGLGDSVLLLRYTPVTITPFSRHQVVLGAGTRIPTGENDLSEGFVLSEDMQPGVGAWGAIAWASYSYAFTQAATLQFHASGNYTYNGENERKYAFGNEFNFTTGISQSIGTRFGYSAMLRYRYTDPDRRADFELPNTGGQWLDFVPSARFSFADRLNLVLTGRIPVARDLNGVLQFTTSYSYAVSLSYGF